MFKQWKLGIYSFIIALVLLAINLVIACIDIIQIIINRAFISNNLLHIGTMISMIMHPFGAGLGLAGILAKETKRGFAIAGLLINGLIPALFLIDFITKKL